MLGLQRLQVLPRRRTLQLRGESHRRSSLEQLSHFKNLQCEFASEPADDPAGIRTPFDQPKAVEAVQILADRARGHAKLPSQLQSVDDVAGLVIAAQHP